MAKITTSNPNKILLRASSYPITIGLCADCRMEWELFFVTMLDGTERHVCRLCMSYYPARALSVIDREVLNEPVGAVR